jgi:toluene monooxygenase system protein A
MLKRDDWLDLARKLDWEFSHVDEREVFPEEISGSPWLTCAEWQSWDEPYRTTYGEYVATQQSKEASVEAVREAVGGFDDYQKVPAVWRSALKLHAATLPLAEFAAVVGNLRAARFGRDSAWRTTALLGALDELRHTQIPLRLMHDLVRHDRQFDWTHRFFHTNDWVAIAGRHLIDELLLGSDRSSSRSRRISYSRPVSPICSSSDSRRWLDPPATGCSRRWCRAFRPTRRAMRR